jgi:hypothetical protein
LATYTPKDPASLFLTANSDTIYFWSFVDLTDSPMVIDVPVMPAPSAILRDDRRPVVPLGDRPGPSRPRPRRGRQVLAGGPRYDGPLPEGGFYVSQVPHDPGMLDRSGVHGRQRPRSGGRGHQTGVPDLSVHARTAGTPVASFLAGRAPLAGQAAAGETRFVDAVHLAMNDHAQ